jgi:hypothetical protein
MRAPPAKIACKHRGTLTDGSESEARYCNAGNNRDMTTRQEAIRRLCSTSSRKSGKGQSAGTSDKIEIRTSHTLLRTCHRRLGRTSGRWLGSLRRPSCRTWDMSGGTFHSNTPGKLGRRYACLGAVHDGIDCRTPCASRRSSCTPRAGHSSAGPVRSDGRNRPGGPRVWPGATWKVSLRRGS